MNYAELIKTGAITLRNISHHRISSEAYWNFVALLNLDGQVLEKEDPDNPGQFIPLDAEGQEVI